jgi:hypothetical protein
MLPTRHVSDAFYLQDITLLTMMSGFAFPRCYRGWEVMPEEESFLRRNAFNRTQVLPNSSVTDAFVGRVYRRRPRTDLKKFGD